METYHLSFCDIEIVDPQIAIFKVWPEIDEVSQEKLLEIDQFLDKKLTRPYGVISDRRGIDYSLSADAIMHIVNNPGPAVIASISDHVHMTQNSLSVLGNARATHNIFSNPDSAVKWIRERLISINQSEVINQR